MLQPTKGTSVRETTCFELQMFNIFLYLWSVGLRETKKLFDWLCACEKKRNFPHVPIQNGLTDFCQILLDNSAPQRNEIS